MSESESPNEIFGAHTAQIMASSLFANVAMNLFKEGILFFMVIYGLSVFLETPKDLRKGRTRYIVISFLLLVLECLGASLDTYEIFKCLFEATSAVGYLDKVDENTRSWPRYVSLVTMTLTILVGDLLLVYRCYVIWQHRWWVAIFPGLTCVAAFVLGIIPLAVTTHGELTEYYYELARVFLTVLTNLMVTSLISFYLIVARRELSKVLPGKDLNLYTGVVAILIESALPLTVTGIIYAAVVCALPRAFSSPSTVGPYSATLNITAFLFFCFTALSPSMIIFRITTGRSWLQFPKQSSNGVISSPLNFMHHTAESSFIESSVERQRHEIDLETSSNH